jgi:hypothetical protein
MRSRFRSFDSKISFFAFADIITAVSGILIFVTLLLATDLGRPIIGHASAASVEPERQIQDILRQQLQTDDHNRHLQELLSAAEIAPSVEKLQSDIASLRSQLTEQERKQGLILDQAAAAESAAEERDKTLGLTRLKVTIGEVLGETKRIAGDEAKIRGDRADVERRVAALESQLLKLRQREGQIWLIPDRSMTTKEPILVTVGGHEVTVERFDHPDQHDQFDQSEAEDRLRAYLRKSRALDQYVVFLVRPSGIELFQRLLNLARDSGFDVGFDAVEESRQVHFSTPPPIADEQTAGNGPTDETSPPRATNVAPAAKPEGTNHATTAKPSAPTNTTPLRPVSAPPKGKSWWQRFLEWIGISR